MSLQMYIWYIFGLNYLSIVLNVMLGVVYISSSLLVPGFFEPFEDTLSVLVVDTHKLIVMENSYIDFLDADSGHITLFNNVCDSIGLKPIINSSTRVLRLLYRLLASICFFSGTSCPCFGIVTDLTATDQNLVFAELDFTGTPSSPRSNV